jgi:hypothetical protein
MLACSLSHLLAWPELLSLLLLPASCLLSFSALDCLSCCLLPAFLCSSSAFAVNFGGITLLPERSKLSEW